MRRKVSSRKRKKVLISAVVICVIAVIVLIFRMDFLTRNVLNNDAIRATVELVSAKPYDNDTMSELFNFTPKEYFDIALSKNELYIIEVRYSFYNYSDSDIGNFSASMSSIEEDMKVYAASEVKTFSESDRIYVGTNYIILDKGLLNEKQLNVTEPMDFKAQLMVRIGYDKVGEYGRKSISFGIVEQKEKK